MKEFDNFVVHEIHYSKNLRRSCCLCNSKRRIKYLVHHSCVSLTSRLAWRCSDDFGGCRFRSV
ncbi:hypothetical protein BAZOLSSOX_1693 [uncultured Gammaproteobacteria bacterium]|jgi:hypothetical protein|nr:hypothetical protein [uncultured Gammaproteobacteria bacterium]VVH59862.1 hypothetical protein BAZOLSSOX_1693 [uncultured Gammaproteobacteria bacterium]